MCPFSNASKLTYELARNVFIFSNGECNDCQACFQIMKTLYDVDPRLSVLKKMKLKKNNIYRIQVFDKAQQILEDLQILTDSGLRYTPSVKMVRSEKWLVPICKDVSWQVEVLILLSRVIIIRDVESGKRLDIKRSKADATFLFAGQGD